MPEPIQHHCAPTSLIRLIEVLHLFEPIQLLSQNVAGPEIPLLIDVFTKVPDDIGFLEEETHGVESWGWEPSQGASFFEAEKMRERPSPTRPAT